MLTKQQSSGPVAEVARFKESTGKEGRNLCHRKTRMTWPTNARTSTSGFYLGQMEASSDTDVFLGKVLQWQNLGGIPWGVERWCIEVWWCYCGREWAVLGLLPSYFPSHYNFDLTLETKFTQESYLVEVGGGRMGLDRVSQQKWADLCSSFLTCSHTLCTYCSVIIQRDIWFILKQRI